MVSLYKCLNKGRFVSVPVRLAARLNEELRLPPKYIAMQVRRGDKVAGNRKDRGASVRAGKPKALRRTIVDL